MADSPLKLKIQDDMKAAMRAKEQKRLSAIRLILNAIKQKEIDDRISLDDTQIHAILDKLRKQRQDAIEQYQAAQRQDLADQETAELKIIESYMPAQISEAELDKLISQVISVTGATSAQDMGKVMAEIKSKVQGRADMRLVSQKIKERLA